MYIYYKYAPHGTKKFVLSYVDDYVYWYNYEALVKWFVYTLGKRFHVNFLEYKNWFMSISISQNKDHSVYIYQDIYNIYIVAKYLDTATIKAIKKFYNTTFPSDMIFTKFDASTSDDQVRKLTMEFNIHYRSCIGSFIYLLSTKVDFSFSVHKLETFA